MKNQTSSEQSKSRSKDYPPGRRLMAWALSPIFFINFFLILVLFHILFVVARCFGHRAMKFMFFQMNSALILNFRLIGTKISVKILAPLPAAPFILASNHQSMFDIPLIVWALRGYDPMFIGKIELKRGVPSVSFCLRNMDGCALIDRKDPQSAVKEIEAYGRNALAKGYVATIFPEGTRSRCGEIGPFKVTGMLTLMRSMPSAPIIPAVVDGSWEMVRYNLWPVPFGVTLELTFLPAIQSNGAPLDEIAKKVEMTIRERLTVQRTPR